MMIQQRSLTLAVATGCLALSIHTAPAQTTDCSARLTGVSNIVFDRYDPFSNKVALEQDTIAVERTTSAGECAYAIVFTSSGAGQVRTLSSIEGDVEYRIQDAAFSSQALSNATSPTLSSSIAVRLDEGQLSQQATVFYAIPAAQIAAAASYQGAVEARLFSNEAGRSPILLDQETVNLSTDVDNRAAVNLAMAPQGFDAGRTNAEIDFGELEEGERERIYVQVRATTDYRVSMNSRGEGSLQLDGGALPDTVSYQARLAGQTLDLGSAGFAPVLDGDGPTSGVGVAHELEIVIGQVSNRPAGEYTDIITIRVESVR